MKYLSIISTYFIISTFSGQNNQKFTIKGAKSVEDQGYVSKRKAIDCNKELEWEEGNSVVFHKRSRKPYTGTCVSYYDNKQLERSINFVLGRENGECFTYYKNGQVKIKSVYVEGVEDGTWGYWYENGQVAWGNTYEMGVKTGEWLYFQEDGKPSKTLNYEDNVFDGVQSYFHKNGKPQKQIN